jgi:hypothetical protein
MTAQGPRTLQDISNGFTAGNPELTYFHGKLFSFIPPDPQKFFELCRALNLTTDAFPNRHPATAVVGKPGGCVPLQSKQVLAVQDGQFRILAQVDSVSLPDCEYLALISPVEISGTQREYGAAFESICFLRSLISLSFGKLPFYTWIADFDFNSSGEISLPGETVRLPLYGDVFKILDFGVNERNHSEACDAASGLQRAAKASMQFL